LRPSTHRRVALARPRRRTGSAGHRRGNRCTRFGMRAPALHGSPLDRFLELEAAAGLGPGRALAAELRYLGGSRGLATALRTFPQTTEQLLHVDKFLERERALPVRLPSNVGVAKLTTS